MKPERWHQIDRLLEEALERDASDRPAFLDQACAGDEALRRKVKTLLDAYEQAVLEKRLVQGPPAFSVSPDGRWILYAQLDQAGSDVMLIENFR